MPWAFPFDKEKPPLPIIGCRFAEMSDLSFSAPSLFFLPSRVTKTS